MDGSQSLFQDVRDTEEAARQAEVYKNAMASIRAEERSREATGYAVMSAMTATDGIHKSKVMKLVQMFLISFAMIMPVIAFWLIALGD